MGTTDTPDIQAQLDTAKHLLWVAEFDGYGRCPWCRGWFRGGEMNHTQDCAWEQFFDAEAATGRWIRPPGVPIRPE